MELIRCDNLQVDVGHLYGGLTGSKRAVFYNGSWYMLKGQQRLRDRVMKNVEIPYANDPITEYIGSHIYELAGIPTHSTLLGTYKGKLCVLCKDFAYPGHIIEFRQLRNYLMDEGIVQHSSGMSTKISDVMEVIDNYPLLDPTACRARFWEMFAIDALIGNTDRNNGNWGFFKTSGSAFALCPVYDCGGCLNNKRSERQMLEDMQEPMLSTMALNYTLSFKDDRGKRINPFHYMRDHMNPFLQRGVNIAGAINMGDVMSLICSMGDVLSPTQRLFYLRLLDLRMLEIRKYMR